MSQFSHPTITVRSQIQAHKLAWTAALLALVVTATIALVMAIDGGSSTSPVAGQSHPGVRPGGGPEESAVAASVGSRPSTGSSESAVAAAVGSGSSQSQQSGPDEAATAAAISGR